MAIGKKQGIRSSVHNRSNPPAPPPVCATNEEGSAFLDWKHAFNASTQMYEVPLHPELPPDLPQNQGELFFECTLFLYSCLALFLQYVNLYKTIWWLPNSYVHHTVKLYLIDPYLLSCVGLILGRRVTLCFLNRITIIPPDSDPLQVPWILRFVETVLKIPMFGAVMSSFMFSFLRVLHTYTLASLMHLFFPILIYMLMFYNELMYRWWGPTLGISSSPEIFPGQAHPWDMIDIEYSKHCCTANGNVIRKEADLLYVDLVQRIKRSLFSAFAVAYYAIYLPTCFTPPTLVVDSIWVFELCLVVFTTSLTLYLTYMFPLQYCDLIHRCAAHLGAWKKVKPPTPSALSAYTPAWNANELYSPGRLHHFDRIPYQALGTFTVVATPNDRAHERFYFFARQAVRPLNLLCSLELVAIVCQFLMLVHSHEWQHIITLVLLMSANYMLLFKLFKDKIILDRCYSTENPSYPAELMANAKNNSKLE